MAKAGRLAAGVRRPGRAVIVTDSNVDLLYSDKLAASLREAGFDAVKFVFPAGEKSKNASTLLSLLNFMAESRLTRIDTVFALGGGVVGDLAGLAASLYMRGVGLVQLPTTLLAAVDSSVGGKTAVDLPAGKNLMGAFYQPDLVICDTDTLGTLPEAEFSNGCAEVIKYGFIRDAAILNMLGNRPVDEIISRCVAIKRDIVTADEHDRGERQLLNFGHTFGHAIETCSGYTIPHGSAVAAGMVIMTTAAIKKGLCDAGSLGLLKSALRACGLSVEVHYTYAELFDTILSDKKRSSDRIKLVIPRRVGLCELIEVSLNEAREFLRLGLGGT
ncbi:MAG: 3-dehydroquinate synthase [Clostridiales bacterium]|nr:3-dehydroquinate synthase [Clostridiales bacterium]